MRLPVLAGPPLDAECLPQYRAIFRNTRLGRNDEIASPELLKCAVRAPDEVVPEPVRRAVSDADADIEKLREAMRCTRVDASALFHGARLFDLTMRGASYLLIAGHLRAQSGDASGAADRYLAALRFAAEMAMTEEGFAPGTLMLSTAALALGNIAVSQNDALPIDQIRQALARMDPILPKPEQSIVRQRATLNGDASIPFSAPLYDQLSKTQKIGAYALAALLSKPALLALSHRESAALLEDAIRIARSREPNAELDFAREQGLRADSTYNPFTAKALNNLRDPRQIRVTECVSGAVALAQAAALVRDLERRTQRAPAQDGIELPLDGAAGPKARIQYRLNADGLGYRLWSAGHNGRDDGGKSRGRGCAVAADLAVPDDLVLERRLPAAPHKQDAAQ